MRQAFLELPTREAVLALRREDLAMRLLRDLSGDSESRYNFSLEVGEAYHRDDAVLKAYLSAWGYLVLEGYLVEKSESGWFFVSLSGEEEKSRINKFGLPLISPQLVFGGRWVVERELGRGGQGVTYLTRDNTAKGDGHFVVKQLREGHNEQARSRFATEARALASLEHPNILRVIHMNIEDANPWFVTEYCPGLGLDKVDLTQADLEFRLGIFLDVCRALAAAHSKDITHRDIKPENILLRTPRGPAVLADFGICWFVEDVDDRLTRQHEDMGSSFCRPPELFDGPLENVTPNVDIYCLGKLLYWLVVGEGGRAGRLRAEEFERQNKNLVSIFDNQTYEHINVLLRRMIVEDPAKRFKNATEVLEAAEGAFDLFVNDYQPLNVSPRRCKYCGEGKYIERERHSGTSALLALLEDFRIYECQACGHSMWFQINPTNTKW